MGRLIAGRSIAQTAALLAFFFGEIAVAAAPRQHLQGHAHRFAAQAAPLDRVPGTNQLKLAIGLPLRNRTVLTNHLREIYTPGSPLFHHYLTPAEFAARYGPSEEDYRAALAFARTNGFVVTGTHPNRMMVNVQASAADIERTFQIQLHHYQHPLERRAFYAPDREPSVETSVPLLHISGLDNYVTPRPMSRPATQTGAARGGTGSSGTYWGNDFRAAYVPGTTLTGTGQVVALFELNGYYPADITSYEKQTGLPQVPLQNVLIDGFSGSPGGRRQTGLNEEVALDIEMALSIAPGLSKVLVYEASPTASMATIDHLLNRIATDNLAAQISCSWGFDIDLTSEQIFLQYAAQGQSFFLASGDSGAFAGPVFQPSDNPNITVVGGTELTTDGSQGWVSETTWNGSGGGISTVYPIPWWQQGIDMSANQGSTSMRNLPDVAMIAHNVLVIADNGHQVPLDGTSIAAPLWAGFMALVNEQAAASGKPPAGFVNPALYALAQSTNYSQAFHDIQTGDNTSQDSPSLFQAVAGYDLCTGWGTPNGTNFINALLGLDPGTLALTPTLGFTASGRVGGPFSSTNRIFGLTNFSAGQIHWKAAVDAGWLTVTPSSGVLDPGAGATFQVALNDSAASLSLGSYHSTLTVRDVEDQTAQTRDISLVTGNSGFETGDFTNWTLSGTRSANFIDSVDATQQAGASSLPGVDDSAFVYNGIYGAFLGQATTVGTLSQTLPTVPGTRYLLSFWLSNPAQGTPNRFRVLWAGNPLFDQSDLDQFGWTNMQYVVTATNSSTVLQFGFRNDQNAFGLDDVSLQSIVGPTLQPVQISGGNFVLTWSAVSGLTYQVQSTEDLASPTWTSQGDPQTATSGSLTYSETNLALPHRFYRIVQAP